MISGTLTGAADALAGIPEFPHFREVRLDDRRALQEFAAAFAPYSDFNFVSLWSWNVDESTAVSRLNGNLIVRLSDYVTGEPCVTFLGRHHLLVTAHALLAYAEAIGGEARLDLVPESVARRLTSSSLMVEEDPDNHDHVLSTALCAELRGAPFAKHRGDINRLTREHPSCVVREVDPTDVATGRVLMEVFAGWERSRDQSREETLNEMLAIERLLASAPELALDVHALFIDDGIVAWQVDERVGRGYAVGHFSKGDMRYGAVLRLLTRDVCRRFAAEGISHINYEQDLGLPGLREAKRKMRPVTSLKKYVVRRASVAG
jgi:uncharacterized protein